MWTPEKQQELERWQGASQAYRDAYYYYRDLGEVFDGFMCDPYLQGDLRRLWKEAQHEAETLVLEKIHGAVH